VGKKKSWEKKKKRKQEPTRYGNRERLGIFIKEKRKCAAPCSESFLGTGKKPKGAQGRKGEKAKSKMNTPRLRKKGKKDRPFI